MTNSGNDYEYNYYLNITDDQLEKFADLVADRLKPVRDERSEESAVMRERTRIIKALEELKVKILPKTPSESTCPKCGGHFDFSYCWCPHNEALDQAIKVVGEFSDRKEEG